MCSACCFLLLPVGVHAGEDIAVVNEGGIRDAWTVPPGTTLVGPRYPQEPGGNQVETCIGVGYLIHPDGHTSDFALLKTWSAQDPVRDREKYWGAFAKSASEALSQWRFVPRPGVAAPREVYTVATFVFASADMQATRKRCAIPELTRHIAQIRQNAKANRKMATGVLGRLAIDPAMEALYSEGQYLDRGAAMRSSEMEMQQRSQPAPPQGGGG